MKSANAAFDLNTALLPEEASIVASFPAMITGASLGIIVSAIFIVSAAFLSRKHCPHTLQ